MLVAAPLAGWLSLQGCTPALPPLKPGAELEDALTRASTAQQGAEHYAAQVQGELSRSERLLSQARELAERAEKAEKSCRELVAKIPKYRKRVSCPTPKATPTPAATPEPADGLEYSPSDAPL